MSTHVPKLLKDDRLFVLVVDPTAIALGTKAQVFLQASKRSLPAETVTVMDAAIAASTAVTAAWSFDWVPKLIVSTAGRTLFRAIQSIQA